MLTLQPVAPMELSTRSSDENCDEQFDDTPPFSIHTQQQIAQAVRADIRQVMANCWELQQLTRTAPKARQMTINNLALPTKARLQQQVTHQLHDVFDFAKWTTEQLAKKRAVREVKAKEERLQKVAQKEALQGWRRQQALLGSQRHAMYQQQIDQQQMMAKQSAALATQRAKQDLQLIKHKQERQKLHADELRKQLATQRMVTSVR